MNTNSEENSFNDQSVVDKNEIQIDTRTIFICGKPGVGKSSIATYLQSQYDKINSSKGLESGQITRKTKIIEVSLTGSMVEIIQRMESLLSTPNDESSRCLALVVGAPDRSLETERVLISGFRMHDTHPPVILALNRIDMIPPLREWNPKLLDISQPDSVKTQNIIRWAEYIRNTLSIDSVNCIYCSFSEEPDGRYGMEYLSERINKVLQERKPLIFTSNTENEQCQAADRHAKAKKIIGMASTIAGGVGLLPGSVISLSLVFTIQSVMLINLGRMYGVPWNNLTQLTAPVIGTATAGVLKEILFRILPISNLFISAPSVALVTGALGFAYIYFLEKGQLNPPMDRLLDKMNNILTKAQSKKTDEEKKDEK